MILLLLVAGVIGYLTAWFYAKSVYKPVIKGLEEEKAGLNKQIQNLNNDISDLNKKVADLEKKVADQDKEINVNLLFFNGLIVFLS